MYNPLTSHLKLLNAANGGKECAKNCLDIGIINLHEEMVKDYDSPWTTWRCPQGIRAAKHKERSGSSTQETPHVLVEEQKKPRHTCYSASNSHIPALWITLLFSMMLENNAQNYRKRLFDDTTMMMIQTQTSIAVTLAISQHTHMQHNQQYTHHSHSNLAST